MGTMQTLRLSCSWFWVDIRLKGIDGRWVASADLPNGPSIGVGTTPREAIVASLDGFEGEIDELLASAPVGVLEPSAIG
jgi:hypothetical protein